MTRQLRHDLLPERPSDLDPEVPPAALLDAYQRHLLALAAARTDPVYASFAGAGRRAVAALALAHAVMEDLAEERWPIVRDALAHGVSCQQVGAATGGLEPDELTAGLTAWADRQLGSRRMSVADHGEVLALVSWSACGGTRSAARPR